MRLKNTGRVARFGVRFLILAAAALVLTLLAETACNYRAFATANLTPTELRLDDFYIDGDKAEFEDGALRVQLSRGDQVHIIYFLLDIEMETLRIDIEGVGAVNVTAYIKDEASEYQNQTVYSVYCVADDPALRTAILTTQSAGEANEFTLRFSESPVGCDFYIRSVTVNAPVPYQWQPVRMAAVFAASLLLLCALFLRPKNAAYSPGRVSHRLIVILPLAGIMLFSAFAAIWSVPDQPLFAGMSKEDALANEDNDCYAALFATLLDGRLALEEKPGEELLYLDNPYDPSERSQYQADFHLDFVLFNGQYYVYHGLGPILAVYAPFYALTGRIPTGRDAMLPLCWFAIAMIGWAVCGIAKRYHKNVGVFALSLCCVTAVFASGITILATSPYFYYLAVLGFVGFSAAAVGFIMHAAEQKTPWIRIAQYTLGGLCVAFAAMSRINATPILLMMLAPVCIRQLANKRVKFTDAAAFLSPMLLGLGVILWYNWARFGSVLSFGMRDQLTLLDFHFKNVRLSDLPQALYYYLFSPIAWKGVFPYIEQSFQLLPSAGHSVFSGYTVGVFAFPVTWAVFLMGLRHGEKTGLAAKRLLREERWAYLAPLLVSVPVMLTTFSFVGVLMRYTCDFRLFFALAGIGCALPLLSVAATPERKALRVICAVLCAVTIFIGFGLTFENTAYTIRDHSPAVYYGLQRMFFPY